MTCFGCGMNCFYSGIEKEIIIIAVESSSIFYQVLTSFFFSFREIPPTQMDQWEFIILLKLCVKTTPGFPLSKV